MLGDAVHGNGGLQTIFRNQVRGYAPYVGTRNTQAIHLYFGQRGYNVIGNVLGQPSFTTNYVGADPSVFMLGDQAWSGGPTDGGVQTTAMLWGNYDVVTNAVRWCGDSTNTGWTTTCASTSEVPTGIGTYANAVPSTQTLPASFYYSSKPSWWPSSKAWPPIGPDVTGGTLYQSTGSATWVSMSIGGHAYSIPAADCYKNVMGGSADGLGPVLSFNESSCYGATQVTAPPSAPTKLITSVH
jgi:hypothetical protein